LRLLRLLCLERLLRHLCLLRLLRLLCATNPSFSAQIAPASPITGLVPQLRGEHKKCSGLATTAESTKRKEFMDSRQINFGSTCQAPLFRAKSFFQAWHLCVALNLRPSKLHHHPNFSKTPPIFRCPAQFCPILFPSHNLLSLNIFPHFPALDQTSLFLRRSFTISRKSTVPISDSQPLTKITPKNGAIPRSAGFFGPPCPPNQARSPDHCSLK
jgi:hypothetical protein